MIVPCGSEWEPRPASTWRSLTGRRQPSVAECVPRNRGWLTDMGDGAGELRVLTLTPFYPSNRNPSHGCSVSDPLEWLAKAGVRNTVFAVHPVYRGKPGVSKPGVSNSGVSNSGVPAEWLRYFALPGGFGLPTAGAFVFARIVGSCGNSVACNGLT